jgi:hypothetical protein
MEREHREWSISEGRIHLHDGCGKIFEGGREGGIHISRDKEWGM